VSNFLLIIINLIVQKSNFAFMMINFVRMISITVGFNQLKKNKQKSTGFSHIHSYFFSKTIHTFLKFSSLWKSPPHLGIWNLEIGTWNFLSTLHFSHFLSYKPNHPLYCKAKYDNANRICSPLSKCGRF